MVSGEANIDRRGRRRAATRDEIVQAAWELLHEHGTAGLSMRELGARVGMRAQSLYQYFASKHEIYDALFADGNRAALAHMAEFEDRFDAATGDPRAQRSALHESTRAFFEFCVSDPVRYELLFQRRIPGFEPSPNSYTLALELFERFAVRLATIGLPDDGVDLMIAMLEGLAGQQIANDPGGDRWADLLGDAVDMIVDRYVPPPRPRAARTQRAARS